MRSVYILLLLTVACLAQHGGIAKMKELRTNIDPIRTFDLPEDAPRARIISTAFLQRSTRKMKTVYKDDSRQEDFKRWKLDELTDRDMRSSKEVKKSVRSPFASGEEEEEKNVGEFFPIGRFSRF